MATAAAELAKIVRRAIGDGGSGCPPIEHALATAAVVAAVEALPVLGNRQRERVAEGSAVVAASG